MWSVKFKEKKLHKHNTFLGSHVTEQKMFAPLSGWNSTDEGVDNFGVLYIFVCYVLSCVHFIKATIRQLGLRLNSQSGLE